MTAHEQHRQDRPEDLETRRAYAMRVAQTRRGPQLYDRTEVEGGWIHHYAMPDGTVLEKFVATY